MNDFLQRYARQSHESGAAKTFLAIANVDNKTILGFYSLAPGALAYADTPETVRRGLARHDVPGFRLARIATDLRFQGQGNGAVSDNDPCVHYCTPDNRVYDQGDALAPLCCAKRSELLSQGFTIGTSVEILTPRKRAI